MRIKTTLTMILLLAALFALPAFAAETEPQNAEPQKTEAQRAELRIDAPLLEAPQADAAEVSKLPRATKVSVHGYENGYYEVESATERGYVAQSAVKLQQATVKLQSSGVVAADDVSLRNKPDIASAIATKLKKGAVVEISERCGNWYKVSDGKWEGYVHVKYIDVTEEDVTEDSDYAELKMGMSGSAVTALQHALKEQGYYGGECNGDYGAKTREAVRKFQEAAGLNPNGIATAQTQSALFAA